MGARQRKAVAAECGFDADLAHYWREGYAVIRGFFSAAEIARIADVVDEVHEICGTLGKELLGAG